MDTMTASDARNIADDAQTKFINQNINNVIEKIDERIKLSAGGSKQYRSSSTQIILEGSFDILNGIMFKDIEKHYIKNGFKISFCEQDRTPNYIVIGW